MCYFNSLVYLDIFWVSVYFLARSCLVNMPVFSIDICTTFLLEDCKISKKQNLQQLNSRTCRTKASFCKTLGIFLLKERKTPTSGPVFWAAARLCLSINLSFSWLWFILCATVQQQQPHSRQTAWLRPRRFLNTGQRAKLCNPNPSLLRLCQQGPCDVLVKEELVEKGY